MARKSKKKKLSQDDRLGRVSQLMEKEREEKPKIEPFSFKAALSAKHERSHVG